MAYQPSFCEREQVQAGQAQVTVRHRTIRSRLRLLIAPLLASAICVTGLFGLRGIAHAQSGSVGYVYDSLGRVIAAYDPSGNAAVYKYDAVGNLLSITSDPANQFSGFNISSSSGLPGSTITIYGTDFCSNPTVTFNGVAGTVVSATSTQIVVTLPSNATTGAVVVTCGSNQANMGTFTISTGAPSISGFSPTIGAAGTAVTINGNNFKTTVSNDLVQFAATNASVSSATASQIFTAVPNNASTGHIAVTTPGGQAVSSGYFFVPPAGSSITSTNSITIGGAAVPVSIPTPGVQGLLAFDGTAGQQISLNAANSTIPPGSGSVAKLVEK